MAEQIHPGIVGVGDPRVAHAAILPDVQRTATRGCL
jgi:hypothetical protein